MKYRNIPSSISDLIHRGAVEEVDYNYLLRNSTHFETIGVAKQNLQKNVSLDFKLFMVTNIGDKKVGVNDISGRMKINKEKQKYMRV